MKKDFKKFAIAEDVTTFSAVLLAVAAVVCVIIAQAIWTPGVPSVMSQNLTYIAALLFCLSITTLPVLTYIMEKEEEAREAARRAEREKRYNK